MTIFKVAGTSDRERRAYRRAVLEQLAANEDKPREPACASVAEGALILLGEFERGDDSLHGYPRRFFDRESAVASLEKAASRFRTSQGTTEPGSRRQGA